MNVIENGEPGEVVQFSFSKSSVADLILNFLGSKERLIYHVDKTFRIKHNDIEQFYYLIEQKIARENNLNIQHFVINIQYNDETSREVQGIDALSKFIETRDVYPTEITLSWNIVLKFPKSNSIENQVIEMSFVTSEDSEIESRIFVAIHHTNQAWAIEILNLLKNKIAEIIIDEPERVKLARALYHVMEYRSLMILVISMLMMSLMGSVLYQVQGSGTTKEGYELVKSIVNSNSQNEALGVFFSSGRTNSEVMDLVANNLITDSEMKNALLNYSKKKNHSDNFLWKGFLISALFLTSILIYRRYLRKVLEFYWTRSFILITKRAEKEVENIESDRRVVEFYSITFVVNAILISVIGAYIFHFLHIYFS